MKRIKYSVSIMVVLTLALVFIGCAKPPEAEKSAAKAAMDTAMSAGADKFAPADFAAAKQVWDTSEAQVKDKKYDEAKQGYITAKGAFEKATTAAAAAKKALTDEVNTSVTGLEEGWKNIEVAAKAVEKKMKGQKEAWDADAKAFAEGLTAVKGMIATDVNGARAKAAELKATIIDKWDAALKALAVAPEKPAKKAKK